MTSDGSVWSWGHGGEYCPSILSNILPKRLGALGTSNTSSRKDPQKVE